MLRFSLLGCAVCFGDPQSLMTKGMNMGIFAMLLVLASVLGAFAKFFLNVRKRASEV